MGCRELWESWRRWLIIKVEFPPSTDDDDDGGGEDDEGDDYDNDAYDDIYIMMKCLFVCLSVTKNDHFLLPSWAPEAQSEVPARPCRP